MKVNIINLNLSKKNDLNSKPNFKGIISPKQIEYIVKNSKTSVNAYKYLDSIYAYNAFLRGLEKISIDKLTQDLYQKFGIKSDFRGNKILAGGTALTANIFHKLGLIKPPMDLPRDLSLAGYQSSNYAITMVHLEQSPISDI